MNYYKTLKPKKKKLVRKTSYLSNRAVNNVECDFSPTRMFTTTERGFEFSDKSEEDHLQSRLEEKTETNIYKSL